MLSEKPVLDQLTLRVKKINDLISEPLITGCKDGNLIMLVGLFQTFSCKRSNREAGRFGLTSPWIRYR